MYFFPVRPLFRQGRFVPIFGLCVFLVGVVVVVGCGDRGAPPAADTASLRTTAQGPVVGYVGDYGSHVWRGIPYARPAVGDLRWRAPEQPAGWSETREALRQGSFCPQFASRFGGVPGDEGEVLGSEDCLFLDIYAKRREPIAIPKDDDRVPVLVWIHGGGNVIGHAGFYDGGNMAQIHDVVVVAINYRLGPLGWFRHASLRDADSSADDRSGNFGTLDMIRALEWVRENIAAFGGDPNNVTIFGESAGGTDVYSLLVSPPASGLFHRAIVQSGGTYFYETDAAENFREDGGSEVSSNEVLLSLLQRDGTAIDRESAKVRLLEMTSSEVAGYLRGKPAEALLGVYSNDAAEGLIELPLVFREGDVIPVEDARARLSNSESWNVVPVIAGTNRDENRLFMFGDAKWVGQWLGFLPRLRDEEGFILVSRYRSLMWRANGSDEPITAMKLGSDAVWSYRFDWDEEPSKMGSDLSVMLGAAHGFEIPFVFGHFDLGKAGNIIFTEDNLPGREELSRAMMSYWVQFAATGDPDRGRDGSLPRWSAWGSADNAEKFIILDTTAGGGLRMAPGSVTQASVLAAAERDPSLSARDDRCAILGQIIQWSEVELPIDCEDSIPAGESAGGS
jgi:para-nitrobenzyl esterase